jgi:hypothetical protein
MIDIDAMPEARKLTGFTVLGLHNVDTFDADYTQELTTRYDTALPVGSGSWDATTILAHLGQYDITTDSDSNRCVQAVSLAMRILQGPAETVAFLRAVAAAVPGLPVPVQPPVDRSQGATNGTASGMSAPDYARTWSERRAAAVTILGTVADRITSGAAKYGHLWWAMEALHDAVNLDDAGTPVTEEPRRLFPAGAATSLTFEPVSFWTVSPAEIVTRMGTLGEHDMFVLHNWSVTFNTMFDKLVESKQALDSPNRTRVTIIDDATNRSRDVVINRISTAQKPAASRIDDNRDTKSGHIMLAFRDGASKLFYEPEIRGTDPVTTPRRVKPTGHHLYRLDDAEILQKYVKDMSSIGLFGYLQIFGKIKR